jgi:Tfp pilus assembly protein PilF
MILRLRLPAICVLAACLCAQAAGQTPTNSTNTVTTAATNAAPSAAAQAEAQAKADPAYPSIQEALQSLKNNDLRTAAVDLADGLQLNPHSVPAHKLLGSLYAAKRLLPEAEQQFTIAEADAPDDISIKFFLADIKMAEGDYAAARAIYSAVEKTPGEEDFTTYKVFLCDLMANQQDMAAQELAAFKTDKPAPSYYFANAAWCVTQHDSPTAKKWLDTAATTFPAAQNAPYAQAMQNIGFIPLPAN